MPESSEQALQARGAELLTLLNGLVRALSLYDANNAAVTRLLDQIEELLRQSPSGLSLQVLEDEFFVDGRLLKLDARLYEKASSLARALSKYGVGSLHFGEGSGRAELDALARDLAAAFRGEREGLQPSYGALTLSEVQGRSVASYRLEPRRLALLLYGGLLDLAETLYQRAAEGKAPSLLPLRRSLQLVVDNMAEHGGIYQVLASVRHPRRPLSTARLRVAVAVDTLGYGIYLGLARRDLFYLGLAALLGGLSDSEDPDEAVQPLAAFPGLGESAMPLLLAVYDARAARQGKAGGVPGRMLAVVERYHELTSATPERPARAPARVLRSMVEGGVPGADRGAARVFLDYKGPYPLGSAVQLSDGTVGVVVAQPGSEGKQRPVVARLLPGSKLGPRVDLSRQRGLSITGVPEPAELGLDLSRS